MITTYDLNIPAKLRSEDAEYEYYARINRAVAQKRLGRHFEAGLEGIPWKAFHSKYKLYLHLLHDEFEEAAAMMTSDVVIEEVGIDGFNTWPIFREFRLSPEFREAYKQAFGREYAPDPERDASTIARQKEILDYEREAKADVVSDHVPGDGVETDVRG